jgi:hypothetical protein
MNILIKARQGRMADLIEVLESKGFERAEAHEIATARRGIPESTLGRLLDVDAFGPDPDAMIELPSKAPLFKASHHVN